MTLPSFVLVTPARNEERYIEGTIRSVIAQTVRPQKWVIVSDGSTDRTDEIVKPYATSHSWLELVRRTDRQDRSFAQKVHAFNVGRQRVDGLSYDIIGNLDADITFDPDYFEYLLSKFAEDSNLGVAGTPFVEGAETYDFRFSSVEHVSGACQLFRRECFEQIGGYTPIAGGGIDWIAVTTARMKGWRTRTFTGRSCRHHRTMGTASAASPRAWFNQGRQDRYLGGHPVWQVCRSLFQMTRKPYVVGGALLMCGYLAAAVTGSPIAISPDLRAFHRSEQMRRLRETVMPGVRTSS